MQLSTPRPHSAAMTCSTVETKTPDSSPSTVASSVAVTEHAFARNSCSGSPSAPQRTKTMPVSASAGFNASVTGKPEWIPAPAIAVRLRTVVCLPDFIARVPPSFDTECVHASDADPTCGSPFRHYDWRAQGELMTVRPPPRRSTHMQSLPAYAELANSRFLTECYCGANLCRVWTIEDKKRTRAAMLPGSR